MNATLNALIRRAGLIVVALVALAAVASAIRTRSWTPVTTLGWLQAVLAVYSRPTGRCARRRGTTSATER